MALAHPWGSGRATAPEAKYVRLVNSAAGPESSVVRVALIDDYEIVLRGLERMLEGFATRVQVVELDAQTQPETPVDVALYDTFSVTQVHATEIDILLENPRVGAVAVYTWNMQADLVAEARRKGVRGYLSKSLDAPNLVAALEKVAAGEQVVLPQEDIGSSSTIEVAAGDWPGRDAGLSARQAEVISLITQGYSNQEIAERTYLTINTLKTYIRLAYRQMGVTSRTQAVLWGIEHDMLPVTKRITRDQGS